MILHVAVFIVGSLVVAVVLDSAIQTFLLPRAAGSNITCWVFIAMRILFLGCYC